MKLKDIHDLINESYDIDFGKGRGIHINQFEDNASTLEKYSDCEVVEIYISYETLVIKINLE